MYNYNYGSKIEEFLILLRIMKKTGLSENVKILLW